MAYAWFICRYKRTMIGDPPVPINPPSRYCAMDDFTAQITADGGAWSETEVLDNGRIGIALVKVNASDATIVIINGTTGFIRVTNHWLLSDTLADLTIVQRDVIRNKLLDMGYTQSVIDAVMGTNITEWRKKTLLTLLELIATRRRKPRYNQPSDSIVCDGVIVASKPVTRVDTEVP